MLKFLSNIFSRSISIWVVLLVVVIFLSNYILSSLDLQLDATFDRAYSLSKGTKQYFNSLEQPIEITFYYSKSHRSASLPIKNYARRVDGYLHRIAKHANGKITIKTISPRPDTDEELWALESGIKPSVMNGENFFLGAVLSSGRRDVVVAIFDPSRERFFEYDMARQIYDLITPEKPKIGILSPVAINGLATPYSTSYDTHYFVSELLNAYDVQTLEFAKTAAISDDIDTLLVFHPVETKLHTEYAIDQFLMRGGNLVLVFDPFYRYNPQGNRNQPRVSNSKLKRLFNKWGVNTNHDQVLGDRDFATIVNTQKGAFPYSFWFTANKDSLSQDLALAANINNVLLVEPGGFRLRNDDIWKLTPIVRSSSNTGFTNGLPLIFTDPVEVSYNLPYESGVWTLMGFLTGEGESAFDKATSITKDDKEDKDFAKELADRPEHIAKMKESGRVLLVADFDFINDSASVEKSQVFGQTYTQLKNDNLNLFFSALYELVGDEKLSLIKPKAVTHRPFEKFTQMQLSAQQRYQKSEDELQTKLRELEESIRKLKPDEGTSQLDLPPDTIEQIQAFKQQELETKKKLRETKKLLREDIEKLITWLTILNLFLVPLAMTFIGVWVYLRRMRRSY